MENLRVLVYALCLLLAPSVGAQSFRDAYCASQSPEAGGLPPASIWVWFGGLDESEGRAYNSQNDGVERAIWTWDAGTADPLEGWTAVDLTAQADLYFGRATAADFAAGACPCIPMFPGEVGEIWCGGFENEAVESDWVLGMGYGNRWCQWARSPGYPIAAGQEVAVDFEYFQDSDPSEDFTLVNILCYADTEPLESYEVDRFSGRIGSYLTPALYTAIVPYAALPPGTNRVALEFRFISDEMDSDEDGGYSCACGPFAADDIRLRIGSVPYVFDFETNANGWTFSECPGIGAFMEVCPEPEWITCTYGPPPSWPPCAMSGNALWCATEIPASPRPGHPQGQHVEMISPIVDATEIPPQFGRRLVVAEWDAFQYLPLQTGTFFRPRFQYYPYWTEDYPVARWSPTRGQNVWHYEGQTARSCRASGTR